MQIPTAMNDHLTCYGGYYQIDDAVSVKILRKETYALCNNMIRYSCYR